MKNSLLISTLCALCITPVAYADSAPQAIQASKTNKVAASFDLLHSKVSRQGTNLVFQHQLRGKAGDAAPAVHGQLGGAQVYSYVWPTSLDSASVGFEAGQGVLALAATIHPDFDDTPLYDENNDGAADNDGEGWHSHWVVLVNDDNCGPGALKVKDIPADSKPRLPATWPGLPILIDSPGFEPEFNKDQVTIKVPLKELGFPVNFNYDGVTAVLTVNANVHDPLLCVTTVHDIASGNLSLPGRY